MFNTLVLAAEDETGQITIGKNSKAERRFRIANTSFWGHPFALEL
jgi:hypothetical protein